MNKFYESSPKPAGKTMMNRALFALAAMLICLFWAGAAQASRDEGYERYREESKIYGTIDSMPTSGFNGTWVISGREVEVTDRTRIKEKYGRAATGGYVEVEGFRDGNKLTAHEIEVKRSREYRSGREKIKLYGNIETLPKEGLNGVWRINGREVTVDRNTRIKEEYGRVAVGAYAEVEGSPSGNTIAAYEIEIKNRR
ncbi:MAG: DUF5666 domain-containing protein [Candidatus Electrothrix sp. YB6]